MNQAINTSPSFSQKLLWLETIDAAEEQFMPQQPQITGAVCDSHERASVAFSSSLTEQRSFEDNVWSGEDTQITD